MKKELIKALKKNVAIKEAVIERLLSDIVHLERKVRSREDSLEQVAEMIIQASKKGRHNNERED